MNFIHAQIESDSEMYYIPSGDNIQGNPYVFIFKFSYNLVYETPGYKKESIVNKLIKDPNFYYNLSYSEGSGDKYYHRGEYLPSMSTSKYEVYGQRCKSTGGYYWHYWAFSKDGDFLIRWDERESTGSLLNGEKRYYVRISKSDLLPQRVNHDFLYE